MGKKKQKWESGDNFLVPLEDGTYGRGQVIAYEPSAMGSALCAFYSERYEAMPLHLEAASEERLIAIQFVTRDLLDNGRWRVLNNGPLIPWEKYIDLADMRRKRFIGTTIRGSFLAASLLNAYHRLIPWNDFHDPEYLDKMLASRDRKPPDVLLK
jgi:hypothetical protein